MSEGRLIARQAGLLIAVFVASLVLLAGAWAIVGRSPSRASTSPGGSPLAAASPAGSPSGAVGPSVGSSGASNGPLGSGGSSEPPPIVITGAGDIADCSTDGAKRTSDLLLAETGSFFTAGDNAYPDGTAAQYAACYAPTWGRFLDRTVLPAAGNHDWDPDGAAGYLGYFGAAAAPAGTTWYSKDLAAWHVVVLDSDCDRVGGCDAGSAQGQWLAKDLAASDARCTLAIWHHPRYSSGEHGSDPGVAPFWSQLHNAGAELVINGHDHDYERFAPLDASGAVERPGGLREIVVGTGGGELRSFHTLAAHSEFRQAGVFGVLRLTLHPANYDWEFLPVAGDIADSGSAPCH